MSRMDPVEPESTGRAPSPARAEERADAALYIFDCRRADGAPICLEAHALSSDAHALAWARKLLAGHQTCSNIEVFDGERLVGAVTHEAVPGETPLAQQGA